MSSLNYMELCRLCLINERVSIPIFEEEGDARQLFMKIASCLPVKVAREDRLPKKICNDCLYKLENVYSFWNTTANAEKQLLEWLGEMAVEKRGNSEATSMTTKTEQQLVPKEETIESDQPKGSGEDQPGSEEEEEEEEESEEEGSNSDESGGGGDAGPKEEAESEEEPYEELEPTTFVNVSLACDEAGPSGMQQRTAPSTSTAPSGFAQQRNRRRFGNAQDRLTRNKNIDAHFDKPLDLVNTRGRKKLKKDKHQARRQEVKSKNKLEKNFKCEVCGKAYQTNGKLKKHQVSHSQVRPFTCDICNKKFKRSYELKNHKKIHEDRKSDFVCEVCNYATTKKANLVLHQKRHFNQSEFKCELCGKGFYTKFELERHNAVHIYGDDRPFTCETCGKGFLYEYNLRQHRKRHNPDLLSSEQYKCDICNKLFFFKRDLNRHKKNHSGEAQVMCDICGKSIAATSMKVHRRIHTGEKPFVCDVCGKPFSAHKYLKLHKRSHTGEKPHCCDQCGKAFTQRSSLTIHLRYHSGEKPYACQLCGKCFVTRTLLKMHQKFQCT